MIEIDGDKGDLKDALESLAYRLLQHEHPTWYEIPDEEIVKLLNEEPGVYAQIF